MTIPFVKLLSYYKERRSKPWNIILPDFGRKGFENADSKQDKEVDDDNESESEENITETEESVPDEICSEDGEKNEPPKEG